MSSSWRQDSAILNAPVKSMFQSHHRVIDPQSMQVCACMCQFGFADADLHHL